MKGRSMKWFSRAGVAKTPNVVPTSPLAADRSADPLFYEQIKGLRAKLEYKIDALQLKTVGITSAIAGEGKTTLGAYLAKALASSGRKRVALVDVDLRKCDLAEKLGMAQLPGLSEVLHGAASAESVLRNSIVPGLFVVPGGKRLADPTDKLSGEVFRAFMAEMKRKFDVILLDSPPVLPVADTMALRDQLDGFLFLYRAGHTPHPEFKQALDEIGEKKVIGVILNGVESRSDKYYKRYYGKYYHKSRK